MKSINLMNKEFNQSRKKLRRQKE